MSQMELDDGELPEANGERLIHIYYCGYGRFGFPFFSPVKHEEGFNYAPSKMKRRFGMNGNHKE
jgi:hypothetical protein